MRPLLLSLMLIASPALAKKKPQPEAPVDPLLPVEKAAFDEAFEDIDLDGEFWVPLAQYDRAEKTAFIAVPVSRVDDVLHTGPAVVALSVQGRVQEAPYLSNMQVAGLLGGRDYVAYDRHAGLPVSELPEAIRQSFEQYANGARAGSVYATTTALQALGRVHTLDWFGHSGAAVKTLERAVNNEIIVKTDKDPSVVSEHVVLVIAGERQVMLLSEVSEGAWIVEKAK